MFIILAGLHYFFVIGMIGVSDGHFTILAVVHESAWLNGARPTVQANIPYPVALVVAPPVAGVDA